VAVRCLRRTPPLSSGNHPFACIHTDVCETLGPLTARPKPSRPAMTLPRLSAKSKRGIYYEMFHGRRVYVAIRSDGKRLNRLGTPIGQDTEDDVIARLAVALDASDPLPPPASVGVGRRLRQGLRSFRLPRSAATLRPCALRLIGP
jgi:hypothetical protein